MDFKTFVEKREKQRRPWLFPPQVEKHLGPGPHPSGSPQSVHARANGGEAVQVGITSARPGKTIGQIREEMGEFRSMLEKTPVKNLSVQLGTGGWEGGGEPTWVTQYDGDGEALRVLARAGKKWNQDAVLVMEEVSKGGQPQSHFSFPSPLAESEIRTIEKILVSEGIGGWTWMADKGEGTRFVATCVPQWGGEAKTHKKASKVVRGMLKDAGYRIGLDTKNVKVTVMDKENYDDLID